MGVVALLCTGRGNPATVKTMAVLSRMLVKPAFQPLASAQSFISKVPLLYIAKSTQVQPLALNGEKERVQPTQPLDKHFTEHTANLLQSTGGLV